MPVNQRMKLIRAFLSFLQHSGTSTVLSLLSVVISWYALNHADEVNRPRLGIEVYDVITSKGSIGGFDFTENWVRCRVRNSGMQPSTLMFFEQDSCCHWVIGVDSTNQGVYLDSMVQLYLVKNFVSSYRDLPITDSLTSLPKEDVIHINERIDPGAVLNLDIGIREFPKSWFSYSEIQMRLVAVFSNGERLPFQSVWRVRH